MTQDNIDPPPPPLSNFAWHAYRSSGPGGQNVNKVSTRVTLAFGIGDAEWLPEDVQERLREQEKTRINKEGVFQLSSDVHRTQKSNIDDAFKRLQDIIDEVFLILTLTLTLNLTLTLIR